MTKLGFQKTRKTIKLVLDNKKKVGSIITTKIHEVQKTGVKVSVDQDKKLIFQLKN